MAQIERIIVGVWTADTSDAGTDGDVYLGLGGREFYLDTDADDFERGTLTQVILGDYGTAAVPTAAALNDPRTLRPVDTAHLSQFPAYIRYHPTGGNSWKLSSVFLQIAARDGTGQTVLTDIYSARIPLNGDDSGIWLSPRSGLQLHLFRTQIFDPDARVNVIGPLPTAVASGGRDAGPSASLAQDLGVLLKYVEATQRRRPKKKKAKRK